MSTWVVVNAERTPTRWTGRIAVRVLPGSELTTVDVRRELTAAGVKVIAPKGMDFWNLDVLHVVDFDAVCTALLGAGYVVTGNRGCPAGDPLPGLTEKTAALCEAITGRAPANDDSAFADLMARDRLADLLARVSR
ncbi:MAG: hypothetical protein HHJ14_02345 [Cellulomonas sp.]|nr:hypothetical protein [Cellulomonas sp.]